MEYIMAKEFLEELKTIPDFRVDTNKIKYPLHEILFMVTFALLKGNTNFKDIWGWMIYNYDNPILKKIFGRDDIEKISRSTFHRIIVNIDNNALEKVFRKYFLKFIKKENVAIDGKWLKGSDANGQYITEEQKSILNILDKDTKLVFAHKFLGKNKTSEITALREVFDEDIFSNEGQVFSFDALHTQVDTLNQINAQENHYIARVKGNQQGLKNKIIQTINELEQPIDSYSYEDPELSCNKKYIKREIEVFYTPSMVQTMYHNKFDNIQSLIRVKKRLTDAKTKEETNMTSYFMANFRTTAKNFNNKILSHWRVETYHYHLDMLFNEDNHIAYKEPFSIAILRSFALNLYQIFHNENKDNKILPTGNTTMAEIKRTCRYNDNFILKLF